VADLLVDNLAFLDRGPYTLTIRGGECCGISGESGAGKTLLLRAIADLDPHTGRIFLGDTECDRMEAPRWRKLVGMLPAESGWWFDRVEDHFSGAEDAGLRQLLHRLGFGENAFSWQVQRLSTGEKQRLALLRLLANDPHALLLDEPTAGLDAENVARTERVLLDYCRDRKIPVLWVSHDKGQLARVADRILTMQPDGGMIDGI